MLRNLTRGILGLILVAAATKLTDMIVDRIFGPEPEESAS
jgi:Ca2+/Na+ antiporter